MLDNDEKMSETKFQIFKKKIVFEIYVTFLAVLRKKPTKNPYKSLLDSSRV